LQKGVDEVGEEIMSENQLSWSQVHVIAFRGTEG
jgi:hypothetical protein